MFLILKIKNKKNIFAKYQIKKNFLKKLFLIQQYFIYLFKAKSAHGIHSPFVFEFIKNILQDQRHFYAFDEIKKMRKSMYHDDTMLTVEDFGAGSHKNNLSKRSVKDIARTAGRNEKMGKLLFKIVEKFKPAQIIELGTSMGLGTLYLSMANNESHVHTIEGSKEIAKQAGKHFEKLNLKNISQHVGNFDDILLPFLQKIKNIDLFFIDGNHRKKPTLQYFEQAKPFLNEHSIVIFDDIHWSKDMHEAWLEIIQDESIAISIDVFYFGIIFFKKDIKEKQHFVLKY